MRDRRVVEDRTERVDEESHARAERECRRSAWKRVRFVEQFEADERRDLRDEPRLDVEVAVERGDVLLRAVVLGERREA